LATIPLQASLAWTLVLATGCAPTQEVPAWPAGTVLALDGVPIGNAWVEEIAALMVHVEPAASDNQRKRLALTNLIFPILASRAIDPERREASAEMAADYLTELEAGREDYSGPVVGPRLRTTLGGLAELGLVVWAHCWEMEPGEFSPVLETIGTFEVFQLLDKKLGALPGQARFTVRLVEFPWLDPEAPRVEVETMLDASRLVIVDPSWNQIVPGYWRHRLGAH
jgi:hypothetical protein